MPRREAGPPPPRIDDVPGRPGGLGTFGGVFTPSILTILGVIMYLRFGWVVGNVGLAGTLVIVTVATSITFLTGLSIAAIATDQRVRIGGAYYMISRSLGVETGGAVGIPLFLALGLSVALYTVGFAESVVGVFPGLNERWVGLITTVAVAVLALTSARAAIRVQYVIMVAIGLSLLSLLFGSALPDTEPALGHTVQNPESFWVVFAVFFPAVTGIMAGVNLSGDLRDPARSIPKGTFAALGLGYLIYMTLPVLLALRADADTLVQDPLVMRRIALWGDAILLGVWGATLSSAVGSILGAPRVLQALARDRVLPRGFRWLGKGSGPEDEPRAGTALTLGIALVAVYFGNLNVIAPILTMFFLTTYGVLNIAAGIERVLGSPSFRPRFRVHWSFSFAGALGCVVVMFLINPVATVVAGLFVGGVYVWLQRREMTVAWGDVRRGIWMAVIRAGLLRVRRDSDPRNWRPHFLVLSGAPTRRWHLIDFANSLSHNRGIVTVSTVLPLDSVSPERVSSMETKIRDYLSRRGVQSLVRVIAAPDAYTGARRLVEAYGMGALVPNTIVLGHSQEESHRVEFCDLVSHFHQARRNVVIVRDDEERGFGDRARIDVWWGGIKRNGGLMLILGYLLKTSLSWKDVEVRLKIAVPDEHVAGEARKNLEQVLARSRTGVIPEVLVAHGRSFWDTLHESSADADLVFMGMAEPSEEGFREYYDDLLRRTEGLPSTVFVLAAEDVEFSEVLFQRD